MKIRREGAEILQGLDSKAVHVLRAENGFVEIALSGAFPSWRSRDPDFLKGFDNLGLGRQTKAPNES